MLGSGLLDQNQAEAIRNAILPVLVSLFSSLPPDAAQKLFESLSKAYPRPLEWVEAGRLHESSLMHQHSYGEPQPKSESVFPHLEDLEDSSKAVTARLSILVTAKEMRWLKLGSVVSESQVDFLGSLAKLVRAKGDKALLAFQLGLLHCQAKNCRSNDYGEKEVSSKYKGYGVLAKTSYPVKDRLLLEDADRAIAIRHLQHVWRYTLKPRGAIEYAAKMAPKSGTCRDVCDFVLPLIELLPELADLKVAFGVLAKGTPEQLINGVSQVLVSKHHAKDVEHLCLYLKSVGAMYDTVRTDATASQWLHPLQDLATRIIDLLTSQEDPDHKQKCVYSSLKVNVVAQVICDAGPDTVFHIASLLQQHSSSFPEQIMILCARFNEIPTSSVNKDFLVQPPFESFLEPVYESKKADARSSILVNSSDPSCVDSAVREFRSFTRQMGMHEEFTAFAREMAALCAYNVK